MTKVATHKEYISFKIKGFKNFWNNFKHSKRGIIGLVILASFIFTALFGPFFTKYDPNSPKIDGCYPAGENPKIAIRLCKPLWQKYLLDGENLVENVNPVEDHEFASPKAFQEWKNESVNCLVKPNLNEGYKNSGCIEISYNRKEHATQPTAKIFKEFTYPSKVPPTEILIHLSALEKHTGDNLTSVTINLSFKRDNEVYQLKSLNLTDKWIHKYVKLKETEPIKEIFSQEGDYTFTVEVQIDDPSHTEGYVNVYLDNLDLRLYGNCFGLLGTDRGIGATGGHPRDLFSTLVWGTRISLLIGLLSAIISTFAGLSLGLIAGYVGGAVDQIIMRFADVLLIIPSLPLLIVLSMILSPSIWNLILIISVMGWMGFSRQTRSMVLSLRERAFIEAAKSSGAGTFYIIEKHIIPNVFALVYVTLATAVPGAIVYEASLSWLGLFDPNVVSWGRILYEFDLAHVLTGVAEYWFWVIPPGVAITLLAISFILIGFALDEILNPRLRKRR